MCAPPAPLDPVISVGPFSKSEIDFITCNPTSSTKHNYIIVVVDYFMKWVEALPTFCFRQDQSSSYYPQANGQVEAINGVLKTMILWLLGNYKTHWHRMLYPMLWEYQTSVKTATGFTPFQLSYGLEAVLPIECQVPSLQIIVELFSSTTTEEECLLYLNQLDETR
eukprot:PITA_20453